MSEIQYISYEETIIVYQKTIEKSGGGFSGIRDKGGIESVLDFVQNDLYYPDFHRLGGTSHTYPLGVFH
ncbi:hypothetical protein FACS189430_08630 [Bacteroidia bacterium]|nr:hypothetical protein FACS189430_08630 [Bacteroidia bacterium]